MKKYIVICFLQAIVLVWWTVLQMLPSHDTVWNYWFNGIYGLVYLVGGLIGLSAIPRLGGLRSTVGKGIFYTSAGLIAYAIGQTIWLRYTLLGKEVPYPSISDVFFVLLMPLLLMGIRYIATLFTPTIKPRRVIEFIFFTVVILVITTLYINQPDIDRNLDLLTKVLDIYYPFADAVILSLGIVALRVVGGKFNTVIIFISLGALLQALADTLFIHETFDSRYWNGDTSDLLFSLAGFAISIGLMSLISLFTQENQAVDRVART